MASENAVNKTPKSAVIIMPPEGNEGWRQIQAIREKHDKSYVRWMPHVNMLYPFLVDEHTHFQDAAEKLRADLKGVKPFTVKFSRASFGYFTHGKSCTLWLRPLTPDTGSANDPAAATQFVQEDVPHHHAVIALQTKLHDAFPACDDLGKISAAGFQPHLSLGQFKPSEIAEYALKFQQNWEDFEFEVNEVCLISRKNFHDPFHIRHTIRLDG